ncbi:hypothetical protein B0H14DRAFT_3492435 [Mycena olivaceomarginata]|nr:hypothetical protein B0H14DRAFT_3492435 [Mycena olivaceomarginata]
MSYVLWGSDWVVKGPGQVGAVLLRALHFAFYSSPETPPSPRPRADGALDAPDEVKAHAYFRGNIQRADKDEEALAQLGTLPRDPLRELPKGEEINLPYTVFFYLIRRLTVHARFLNVFLRTILYRRLLSSSSSPAPLCTCYCLMCHNKLTAKFEALKPYVCDRPLCTYQYLRETVDLLVSLCYSAAAEGVLDEPLPKGTALRVPPPDKARITAAPVVGVPWRGAEELAFDHPPWAVVPTPSSPAHIARPSRSSSSPPASTHTFLRSLPVLHFRSPPLSITLPFIPALLAPHTPRDPHRTPPRPLPLPPSSFLYLLPSLPTPFTRTVPPPPAPPHFIYLPSSSFLL